MSLSSLIQARHIQNFSEATELEPHWGYADRAVPCTNDAGSCEYLDQVYGAHDAGMIYVGAFWALFGFIILAWAAGRRLFPSPRADELAPISIEGTSRPQSFIQRSKSTVAALGRRYLLPECARPIFGRTTRLQVAILAILSAYLFIFSFAGFEYKTWVTPVKKVPGVYNTRTSLGPWSDRIGVLAYALTPLSILLASRESLLSVLTGVPYQHFNFLHRWLGYIIFAQSILHTVGWSIIEIRLYQPQPSVAIEWVTQVYIIWGIVAMILFCILFALSTPWGIRATGYETFRKAHYVLAMIYIGACWAHWWNLSCFMIPSLVLWVVDRAARLVRTALLHYTHSADGTISFRSAQASISHFPDPSHGDVVRLDFRHLNASWELGQHYYLTFPQGSIWQSHPFTPLSVPIEENGAVTHSYIFRAKAGETKKIAALAAAKIASSNPAEKSAAPTTPVILSGPYGSPSITHLTNDVNVLCVAGGTGITFVLPVLIDVLRTQRSSLDRRFELIWAVRRKADTAWAKPEMAELRRLGKNVGLKVQIFVTREFEKGGIVTTESKENHIAVDEAMSSSGSDDEVVDITRTMSVTGLDAEEAGPEQRHPDLETLVGGFVESTVRGRTAVYASGPGGIGSDLRRIVAGRNVWKKGERGNVDLICDDRLEW